MKFMSFSELPGVVRVMPNRLYRLQTTRSWDSLGLSSQSQSNLLNNSNNGDGIIIGIFDTGLVIPSFLSLYIHIYMSLFAFSL